MSPLGILVLLVSFGGIAEIDEDPPTTDSRNLHSEVHLFVMNSLNVPLVISLVCFSFFYALIHCFNICLQGVIPVT